MKLQEIQTPSFEMHHMLCLPFLTKNKVRTLYDDVYSIDMMDFLRSLAMIKSFNLWEACEVHTMLYLKLESLVQLPDDLSSHSMILAYSNTTYHKVSIARYVISGSSWEDEHAAQKASNCQFTSETCCFLAFVISTIQYIATGSEECKWEIGKPMVAQEEWERLTCSHHLVSVHSAPSIIVILPLMLWYQQIIGDNAVVIWSKLQVLPRVEKLKFKAKYNVPLDLLSANGSMTPPASVSPQEKLHHYFEKSCNCNPDATALHCINVKLSYVELHNWENCLTHFHHNNMPFVPRSKYSHSNWEICQYVCEVAWNTQMRGIICAYWPICTLQSGKFVNGDSKALLLYQIFLQILNAVSSLWTNKEEALTWQPVMAIMEWSIRLSLLYHLYLR